MTLDLRTAVPSDAPAIAAILGGWVDETPWMPRVHSHFEDRAHGDLLITRTQVTVADHGRVRGFLARRGPRIEALYVAAPDRGQGVGSALIRAAQEASARLELWCFRANRCARDFYARHGFRETLATDGSGNDEGLPDVFMEWSRTLT